MKWATCDGDVKSNETIPKKWPIVRLRYYAKINPSKSELIGISGNTEVSFIPMEAVQEYGGLHLDQTKTLIEVSNGYTYFRDGDIVVAKITPCFENGKGSIAEGLENRLGFGTTELHVLRPCPELDGRFLFYITISHAFRRIGAAYMYGAGGQKRVPGNFVRNFQILLPQIETQRSIAALLDRETARIDALIEKKKRQIELLQEKRTALITHAVTQGLNPNVKMKDSGIEWLGQIPEHWEVRNLKYLINGTLVNGLFKKKEFFGTGTKLINVFDVYRENFIVDNISLDRVEADAVERQKYGVEEGDIFFVRSSLKLQGVGRSVCAMDVPESTVFECHLVRARPVQEKISPGFLIHFLNSSPAINRFVSLANLVTMATIDQDKIKTIEVPLPPRDEQEHIMTVLDRDGARTERLKTRITDSIQKLQEYRSALISAAVTGKIDVRNEVA